MKLWKHIGETYGLNHEQTSTLLTSIANEVERRGTIDYDRDPGETSDWLRAEANEALKFQIVMTEQHPITPPEELLQEWCQQGRNCMSELNALKELATQAARWGADQELEACIKLLSDLGGDGEMIRRYRRPNPPSLKEQSIALIDKIQGNQEMWQLDDLDTIRRALESLPS